MAGIDAASTFIPVCIAILTISDTRTAAEDKSGNLLEAMIAELEPHVVRLRAQAECMDSWEIREANRAWDERREARFYPPPAPEAP